MARDALQREESCGGHFREEYQTPEREATCTMMDYAFAACWKHMGENADSRVVKRKLDYEFIQRQQRNYKA